jgi:uncharacterized membrane protein YdbT with pleckstrin-like domain
MVYVYVIATAILLIIAVSLEINRETRISWASFAVLMILFLSVILLIRELFFSDLPFWISLIIWLILGPLAYGRYYGVYRNK